MIKKISLTALYVSLLSIVLSSTTFAANPGPKIEQGLQQVQTFLTGIVVIVGVCAGIWIVIKKLPGIDDPMVKNEMFRGVGMVLAGVAVGAALVWLVPWVFNLFQ
ncbi:CagC family type IV secretion system protein [Staphylococcus aureus]|uniref:CagC family type IV secretion system protein n=1 Tax=Staphylococcus aureus TaxID=1280 RepID=UPI0018EAC179|nr:CagC family type IV secretion system protein [Staphylococcus aureus]MBJ6239751.1 hypothetical protein [Staphylococcus aureus]